MDGIKRILLHEYWGELEFVERKAKVYLVYTVSTVWRNQKAVTKEHYEVDFYTGDEITETRKMITEGVHSGERTVHSESYAEDAAENWCQGLMP